MAERIGRGKVRTTRRKRQEQGEGISGGYGWCVREGKQPGQEWEIKEKA